MKLLTLVRHAKSSWDNPDLEDFERPLNERGRRDAPMMAERVRGQLPRPDRLVSSPALRAITTARRFAEALGLDANDILIQPKIYDATLETLLRLLRQLDDGDGHAMLFGHNPGFSELSHALARCNFNDLPTCAVVHLQLDIEHWGQADGRCGKLLAFLYPKQAVA